MCYIKLSCAICYKHCTAIKNGPLLYAITCFLGAICYKKQGVAAICYYHFWAFAICYIPLNGLCYMLLHTPWGALLIDCVMSEIEPFFLFSDLGINIDSINHYLSVLPVFISESVWSLYVFLYSQV